MTRYIGLLRAVNVGGTGKLPMSDLRDICADAGFDNVRTYIASGNLVFDSDMSADGAKTVLEHRLEAYAGKPVGVIIREVRDVTRVLAGNPFGGKAPSYTTAIFLDARPPEDALTAATGQNDELMALGDREIYVYYGSGMGRSKLRIPAAANGTARNMNTIAKLVEMASEA